MIYLLDTDTLIFMIRGLKAPVTSAKRAKAEKLVAQSQHVKAAGDAVGLSAITVAELEYGAQNADDYDDEMVAVRLILTPFDLYPFDAVACPMHYGRIRYDLEQKGEAIGAMDLLIAAHALTIGATLVSNNLKHFRRVPGLKVVSWV